MESKMRHGFAQCAFCRFALRLNIFGFFVWSSDFESYSIFTYGLLEISVDIKFYWIKSIEPIKCLQQYV